MQPEQPFSLRNFMRKNARDRWLFRLCLVSFMALFMLWLVFATPVPESLPARQAVRSINIGLTVALALYALYHLVWKRRYTTLPEYRALKRTGDAERLIDQMENDARERPDVLKYGDKAHVFLLTPDYVFATHWHDGGFARLEDLVCCTYSFERNNMAELYVWVRKKKDSIKFHMTEDMAEQVSDYLFHHSPAMIGFDPKLKLLRLVNYRAYTASCLEEGRLQRQAYAEQTFSQSR